MKNSLTFEEIIEKTKVVLDAFKKVEKRKWGAEGATIELMKQVGELSRLVMVTEGYYLAARDTNLEYQASKEKIADELADILLMIIRLAIHYEIDLENAHLKELKIALEHPDMQVTKS